MSAQASTEIFFSLKVEFNLLYLQSKASGLIIPSPVSTSLQSAIFQYPNAIHFTDDPRGTFIDLITFGLQLIQQISINKISRLHL